MWGGVGDSFGESVISSHHMGSIDLTQVIDLGIRCLDQLKHLMVLPPRNITALSPELPTAGSLEDTLESDPSRQHSRSQHLEEGYQF